MTLSILQAAQTCLQDLGKLSNNCNPSDPTDQRTWVQRRIVDFNTWATLSGVFREGIYGLDAKLCLRPDLQTGLISLLDVFNALMSTVAEKSESCRRREIEQKFSEIVSMTVYLRKSLADTGLWPDRDRAQRSPGVSKEVRPRLAQSLSGNTNTAPERVPTPDQRSVNSELLIRLEKASSRRNELFMNAKQRWVCLATDPKSQNIWPPPKTNQFPPVPLVEAKHTSFICQFCYQDLPTFFSDAYAWREHFLQDLSPYTCVLPNCPQSHCVYSTQSDWEEHMKSVVHDGFLGRLWSCKICLKDFSSMDHLLHHLRDNDVHATTSEVDAQSLSKSISYMKLDLCHLPCCFLCNEDMTGVKVLEHIASCMEIFALKSLESEPTTRSQADEIDCATKGTPLTSLEISCDAGQDVLPISAAGRSIRRSSSVPGRNTETPEYRSGSKRRSMGERNDTHLSRNIELGRTRPEERRRLIRCRSTDFERGPAKFRKLSKAASRGPSQYSTRLDEPRRKTGPHKRLQL